MSDSAQPKSMPEDPSEGAPTTRRTLIERAIRAWTDQLVDLSGRNGLLHYRDLPVGTLDLGSAEPTARDALLDGGKSRLSLLYPDPEALKASARRCRKIREKAKENLEERGIDTLYLVSGLATWTPPPGTAAIPSAPVLLHRVDLTPRGAAGEDFDLAVVGESELNPTLFYALEAQFGIAIDSTAIKVAAGGPDGARLDADTVFAAVATAARTALGFGITDRLVMGNFSYTKLPMVEDLKHHPDALAAHTLIAAIAGDSDARKVVRDRQVDVDPRELDAIPAVDELLVLDADASQQSAIEAITRGSDAVIQGPPGTGKSQTIANLIASATGKGQRVLFVAEKRAAIDAVVGRLNRVGLADLVLDLHGGVKSRRKLAESLSAALGAARSTPPQDATVALTGLQARKTVLGAHARAVNEPHQTWGVSLFTAESRALATADLALDIHLAASVTDAINVGTLEQLKEQYREYLTLGGAILRDGSHPWSPAGHVDAEIVESVSAAIIELAHGALSTLGHLARSTTLDVNVKLPTTVGTVSAFARLLERRLLLAARVDDAAFDVAVRLAPILEPAGRGWFRRLVATLTSASYREAMQTARSHVRAVNPAPHVMAELIADAAAVTEGWMGLGHAGAPPVPSAVQGLSTANERVADLIITVRRAIPSFAPDETEFEALAVEVAGLERDLGMLRKLPRIQQLRTNLTTVGLEAVIDGAAARHFTTIDSLRALDGTWARSVCDRILARSSEAGGIDAASLTEEAASFMQLDREHIALTASRVKRAWAQRAVAARDAYPEQNTLVSMQAKRKIGHLPVRELFARAPEVLTAVKPCWAMSPLLVSQILPADRPYFDLVIFDEASQILPADAIPSILRGHRTVVAGDDLQLPPTTFFATQTADDRDDDDDEPIADDGQGATRGFDSILDIADPLIGSQPLRWHYRSRDERLIAYSNLHIYRPKHRELTTFPAVSDDGCIRHVRVTPRLDRTDGLSSSEEVKAVVELILDHARSRPTESLGVIAMGIKHAERIGEALRQARIARADLDPFFAEGGPEPFFVKNLERVQGDERDAIILTIGYTPGPDGRLRQQFGPVNQQGGERRLNVAITRAKRRICVVSSFGSEDVDPSRSTSAGVRILQGYLRFAESGGADLGDVVAPRPELNGFEHDVLSALGEMGIEAIAQLGTSGYVLDFALQHPTKPGRFVLAVECDGASYHSAPNTRERDRLRQQQLEAIGWRFHRIWSTDWFRDRSTEAARLRQAFELALAASSGASGPVQLTAAQSSPTVSARAESPARARGPRPLIRHYKSIDFVPRQMIDATVRWIESDGLLRTEDEIVVEATTLLGFQRRGRKITAAIEASIDRVRRSDRLA